MQDLIDAILALPSLQQHPKLDLANIQDIINLDNLRQLNIQNALNATGTKDDTELQNALMLELLPKDEATLKRLYAALEGYDSLNEQIETLTSKMVQPTEEDMGKILITTDETSPEHIDEVSFFTQKMMLMRNFVSLALQDLAGPNQEFSSDDPYYIRDEARKEIMEQEGWENLSKIEVANLVDGSFIKIKDLESGESAETLVNQILTAQTAVKVADAYHNQQGVVAANKTKTDKQVTELIEASNDFLIKTENIIMDLLIKHHSDKMNEIINGVTSDNSTTHSERHGQIIKYVGIHAGSLNLNKEVTSTIENYFIVTRLKQTLESNALSGSKVAAFTDAYHANKHNFKNVKHNIFTKFLDKLAKILNIPTLSNEIKASTKGFKTKAGINMESFFSMATKKFPKRKDRQETISEERAPKTKRTQ